MKIVQLIMMSSLLLAIVGCGDDDSKNEKFENFRTKSLKTLEREANYLVNDEGKTLYIFDKDSLDKSNCDATCQETWPLALGTNSNEYIKEISNSQGHLSYLHHPLYTFKNDKSVGDIKGNNIKDVWHVVFPNKFEKGDDVKLSTTKLKQTYLTDANGIALYVLEEDTNGVSTCYGGCEQAWPVFYSDDLGVLPQGTTKEDFGTIDRDKSKAQEGEPLQQTTYKGMPLYYYTPALQAIGDTRCDWGDNVWHLVEIVK